MYNQLIAHHSKVDNLVEPHRVSCCKIVEVGSYNPIEVIEFMKHMTNMKKVELQYDKMGLLKVKNTPLKVEIDYAGKVMIISRYGKLVIPVAAIVVR